MIKFLLSPCPSKHVCASSPRFGILLALTAKRINITNNVYIKHRLANGSEAKVVKLIFDKHLN